MGTGKKFLTLLVFLGVVLLQLIMTQVVTFPVAMLLPGMETSMQTRPFQFVLLLGLTGATGVFLAGWLALKLRWLKSELRVAARLAGALAGAYLPLVVALLLSLTFVPGSPVFFISYIFSILGFHLPGWLTRK